MDIRDRIRELRRVPASQLRPSPFNWRTHPKAQLDALRGLLAEIGFAGAALARELDDGSLELIDGHARADVSGDSPVPVLVLDVTQAEAQKILATFDPLGAMATADAEALDALLEDVSTDNAAVAAMLDDLAHANGVGVGEPAPPEETEVDAGDLDEDGLDLFLKSPYPWFGGKARVAAAVWKRFGDVKTYIEPFFGSGAVFLNRPQPFEGNETVNDADGMISNFWRAVAADPEAVAHHCDWPANENDLHARHAWLVARKQTLQARLEGDPDHFDAKVAGWWCWGMSLWIGAGFCAGDGPWQVVEDDDGNRKLETGDAGRGVNRKRVHLGDAGRGVNRKRVAEGEDSSEDARAGLGECGLSAWIAALADRLRRVRVCCGDWTRVCGGNSGDALSHFFATGKPAGVFLDPPYKLELDDGTGSRGACYNSDGAGTDELARAVFEWALAHGDDPRLRICLCGYDGEHRFPPSWECVKWKSPGGMAGLAASDDTRGKANAFRERLWFSPHCLR